MNKHTPGPWCAVYDDFISVIATETGCLVAGIGSASAEHDANARLIAAAPDLLAAAYKTVSSLRDQFCITETHDDEYIYDEMGSWLSAAYFSALVAIAKSREPSQSNRLGLRK